MLDAKLALDRVTAIDKLIRERISLYAYRSARDHLSESDARRLNDLLDQIRAIADGDA